MQPQSAHRPTARDISLGLAPYLLWGVFPLYFHALQPAGALEVIVHRAVWGLASCLLVLVFMRRLGQLRRAMSNRTIFARLSVAGLLIAINWTTYVYAVQSGHTVDAALGYFINPLVTVVLGMVVLKERITRLQTAAVVLGVIAVVIIVVGLGNLPWVSLVLAGSFGAYALVKKDVANQVEPIEGMAVETMAISVPLVGYYIWLLTQNQTSIQNYSPANALPLGWHVALLVGAGAVTMIPLVLFAAAAKRLPLTVIGMLQYVNPIIQLIIGVLVFHEAMQPTRWVATGVIWIALVVLTVDAVRTGRQNAHLQSAN
ncbi:EamA family transporter RarD [Rarobacter incanus]|nr:EamA family transporter RarD [Rarobacter incanus]